jgi:glyoxylase-like metal-dependent hydrolase (beta-lactamase superfamily II)
MQVHQVKGRHVNSYIIEEASGLMVVDVAWRGEKYVLGYIREVLNREPEDVKLVICTHGDPDHSGGIVRLANTCRAKLGIPYATQSTRLKFINDPAGIFFRLITAFREGLRPRAWTMYANPKRDAHARTLPSYTPQSNDHHEGFDGKPNYRLKDQRTLPGFRGWRVIHTPGHSWDSCCYYHKATHTLISGDTLLGSTKKGLLLAPSIYSNPVQMKRTIKLLKDLDPTSVYPGHGGVFEGKGLLNHL